MKTKFNHIVLMMILSIMVSCDTESNVEPRFEQYFVKYYGEAGNQTGAYFTQLEDGGFLIVGTSIPNANNKDMYLVRTDVLGNQLWASTYGAADIDEEGVTVEVIPDGTGYIVAGNITFDGVSNDVFIVKTDLDGLSVDSAVIGYPAFNEQVNDILITSNNNIMIAGSTTNLTSKPASGPRDTEDFYFPIVDMNFLPIANWTGRYGFDSEDRIQSVDQKPDGKFIFFGTSDRDETTVSEKDQNNMIVFQITSNGLPDGDDQTFGTTGNEIASSMSPTSDGGYVMIGSTKGEGVSNAFISRINAGNNLQGTYRVSNSQDVIGKSIYEISTGGGYIILGVISNNADNNILLSRTDVEGNPIWQRTFGADSDDEPGRVIQLSDGSFVLTGTVTLDNQTKIVLIKTNEDGDLSP